MSERGKALSRVRRQVLLVRTLGEALHRAEDSGADTAYIADKLRKETRLMIGYEQQARAHLDGLTPQLYAFAVMYFIAGESLEKTAEAIDRSARQCGRYKRALLREENKGAENT